MIIKNLLLTLNVTTNRKLAFLHVILWFSLEASRNQANEQVKTKLHPKQPSYNIPPVGTVKQPLSRLECHKTHRFLILTLLFSHLRHVRRLWVASSHRSIVLYMFTCLSPTVDLLRPFWMGYLVVRRGFEGIAGENTFEESVWQKATAVPRA